MTTKKSRLQSAAKAVKRILTKAPPAPPVPTAPGGAITAENAHNYATVIDDRPVRMLGIAKCGNKFAVIEATVNPRDVKVRLGGFLESRRALDKLRLEENLLYVVGKLT